MRLLPALLLLLSATAASAADPELLRCRAIADGAARLACYDALAAAPTPPAPAAAAGLTIPKPADFGFEQKAILQAIDGIDSRVIGLFEGWGPKSFIRLENGQVWQVIDGSRAVIDKRDVKVRITRGALGTFVFQVEGRNATARVQRVE